MRRSRDQRGAVSRAQHQNALSLTPELWAEVFARLEERATTLTTYDDLEEKQSQTEVHQLKRVCKQFRQIYASDSRLVQKLYLYSNFSLRSLASLLVWLQHNKSSVKIFRSACGSPLLDAVLAGLVSPEPHLRMLDLAGISACSISIGAAFTGLEKCSLQHNEARLSLEPLGALSRLNHLVLQGHFHALHHLTGLTRLDCIRADVLSLQRFKTMATLKHLEMQDGILARTLSAYTALTKLVFSDSVLVDSNDQVYLDGDLSLVPTNIDLLTQLHTLYLSTTSNASGPASLGWISKLVTLQDLSISFGSSHDQVLQHAAVLTRLTSLYILGLDSHLDEPYVLDIDIDWDRLQALQDLSICFCSLKLGHKVAGLLKLHCLKHISFGGSTVHDGNEADCFTALIYGLARVCPHVKVVVDSGDVLHYFD